MPIESRQAVRGEFMSAYVGLLIRIKREEDQYPLQHVSGYPTADELDNELREIVNVEAKISRNPFKM